jgi:hypothetical protein
LGEGSTAEDAISSSEFFAAEDANNNAADLFHDAISNFIKPDSPACDGSTDSPFRDATKSSSLYRVLRISKFSGNFSDWENFCHSSFLLIPMKTLKFYYLKSSITGCNLDQ